MKGILHKQLNSNELEPLMSCLYVKWPTEVIRKDPTVPVPEQELSSINSITAELPLLTANDGIFVFGHAFLAAR